MVKKIEDFTEEETIEREHELYQELKGLHKAPPHKLFKALQSQYLLNKIVKTQQERLGSSVITENDMFRACQLGYNGMKELRDVINEKVDNIGTSISEEAYRDMVIPLGNFIIGYKVISNYCNKYLEPNEINYAKEYYGGMKQRIKDFSNKVRWMGTSGDAAMFKQHGVSPLPKTKPEIIYNINRKGISSLEEYVLKDFIKEYESKTGKNAFWKGAKTEAFKSFLRVKKRRALE